MPLSNFNVILILARREYTISINHIFFTFSFESKKPY